MKAAFTRFVVRQLGAAGALVALVLIVVALSRPRWPRTDPRTRRLPVRAPGREFPMGTDQLGRDLLSRVIWGARLSLYVGVVSVVFGITLGSVWGAVTGYLGGAADAGSQRVVDSLMALPPIILALSLMAALGQSVDNVILALVILLTPTAARTVRSVAQGEPRRQPFIQALRAAGASQTHHLRYLSRTAWRLHRSSPPHSYAIVVGLAQLHRPGAPPTKPSWGGMLTADPGAGNAPWMVSSGLTSAWPCSFQPARRLIRDLTDPRPRRPRVAADR
jgi:peptide/nickel transport system permease protein